jgi:Ca2+-binding EF-hand superfamily protein
LRTERGTPLTHLKRVGERVVLKSKVDGREHEVTQVAYVVDPKRPEFNPDAAAAMTKAHGKLECYVCHSNWNPNFLGFHFDRNESLTQLDLLSGAKTKGRVTTQEKVFATWKSFYAGLNEAGRFAPYLTGFSTMGTARDADGEVLVDQGLPVTAAGLSGMAMIHHQMHTVRATARTCIECHRSSATWGLGSANFELTRQRAFVADRRGIEIVALERTNLSASTAISKLVLPDIVALELDCDPLQGRARTLFAAEGQRGIHVLDASDDTELRRTQFVTAIQPKALELAGEHLFVADGVGGLRVFAYGADRKLELASVLPTFDAHDLFVQWPYVYVADGPGGVLIVDVRNPAAPSVAGGFRVNDNPEKQDDVVQVAVLFQYSRPRTRDGELDDSKRTPARLLVAALDASEGLFLFDATEPRRTSRLFPDPDGRSRARRIPLTWHGLHLASHVDLAEPQGGSRTREADYVYLLGESSDEAGNVRSRLQLFDVTEPRRARSVGMTEAGYSTEMLAMGAFYNTPFLQTVALVPGELGVTLVDASVSAAPKQAGAVSALRTAYVVALEKFPLDQMLDESGRALKDVSHVGSRWLKLSEIDRLLRVPGELLGTVTSLRADDGLPAHTARLHFARLDTDRSGVIDGAELAAAGAGFDANGDGRLLLAELAGVAGLQGPSTSEAARPQAPAVLATRVDRDGDLSRLLDGLWPFAFDANKDGRLDRSETERAFFTALDLDGDGSLSPAELSRNPGDWRQLRYGGEWAAKKLREFDANRNGSVQVREYALAAADFEALDVNRDGYVQLDAPSNRYLERRGILGPQSEWPTRRQIYSTLPPGAEVDAIRVRFDADKDGKLTQREMRRRLDLFTELDLNADGVVSDAELAQRIGVVNNLGVDAAPDRFVERWDLDGDGKVTPQELPAAARILLGR